MERMNQLRRSTEKEAWGVQKLTNCEFEALRKSKQTEITLLEKDLSKPVIKDLREIISELATKKGFSEIHYFENSPIGSIGFTSELIDTFNRSTALKK